MRRIDVTTQIARPVQDVWGFVSDLKNTPRWTRSGSELRQRSAGALGMGATIESVRHVFGREIRSQALAVTHYDPGHEITYNGKVAILGRLSGGFTFEDVDGDTRISRWSELESRGLGGLLGAILAPVIRRGQETELANLKRLMETGRDQP